ncbi:MAG TPA: 6-phosphogluconolactonase [Acidimicrobiia bacterium]|nr:6-phosphogluconolactonase [Acidimicrobiia bacterium]
MNVRIFSTVETLSEAAADEVEGWLGLDGNGHTLGLAGGTTPQRAYELLADRDLPWQEVTAWMTDERHVPNDHPDSNAGMAQRALFDRIPARLLEVPWREDAKKAADEYEAMLGTVLRRDHGGRLEPGMVVLGMGSDGHTASLFPGSDALDVSNRDFVATLVPDRGWRLTATLGLLTRARRILFLAAGEEKAPAVADILSGESDLPAARVTAQARDVVWLIDRAAASQLH